MELPDFHIPHAEKIEWTIETHGWALETIAVETARTLGHQHRGQHLPLTREWLTGNGPVPQRSTELNRTA